MSDPAGGPGDGLRRRSLRAAVWSLGRSWSSRAVALVVFAVLARFLDPAEFGVVALASVFVTFLVVVADHGLAKAVVQRRDLLAEHLDTAFWSALGTGVVAAGLVVAGAGPAAAALDEPDLAPILRALSLVLVLAAAGSVPVALAERDLDFRALTARAVIAAGLGGSAAIAVAAAGGGAWALVAQQIVHVAAATATIWQVVAWRPRLRWSRRRFAELFSFAGYTLGSGLLDVVSRRADDLLVGSRLGTVALGYYTVAYRLVLMVVELFIDGLLAVALPVMSRLQGAPERLREAYRSAGRLTAAAVVPVYALLAVLAEPVLRVGFGDRWSAAADTLTLLALGTAVSSLVYLNRAVLLAAGRARAALLLNLAGTVAMVVAFAVGVRWGIEGVAGGFLVRAVVFVPVVLVVLQRLLGIPARGVLGDVLPLVVAATVAAGAAGVVLVAGLSDVLTVVAGGALGLVAYAGVLAVAAPGLVAEARGMVGELRGRQPRADLLAEGPDVLREVQHEVSGGSAREVP